jgi:hypothetical protein
LRAVLAREDDYVAAGKPACDYDDPAARLALVDALTRDGLALLGLLSRQPLGSQLRQAAELLATALGQDVEKGEDGTFQIVHRVAPDRVISTVDPQARHGRKTQSRSFDGYKGHLGVDPDSEIITATTVTPGNAGDASAAETLIADLLTDTTTEAGEADAGQSGESTPAVYGDNAYGTGDMHERLEDAGIESKCKTQQPTAAGDMFAKDRFAIDLDLDHVTCPNGVTRSIRRGKDGTGIAYFGNACVDCPLRAQCTKSTAGRTIAVGLHERQLAAARARQAHPEWIADYRATRPKVERKIGHLMRRKHGGRRARVRGTTKIAADFALLAAAVNLARLATLGLVSDNTGSWARFS